MLLFDSIRQKIVRHLFSKITLITKDFPSVSARQSVEKLSDLSDISEDEDAINVDVMRDYQVSRRGTFCTLVSQIVHKYLAQLRVNSCILALLSDSVI